MSIFRGIKSLTSIRIASFPKNVYFLSRITINTSTKSNESSPTTTATDYMPKTEVKRKVKNWQSYGFDYVDQRLDLMWMHSTNFFLWTVLFWGCIFIFSYYPDVDDMDWIQREAYIELRRREVLGLPLIDKDYARPENIPLPPDEEIGDDEIII